MLFPLVTPEIVMAVSLLLVFSLLYAIPFGTEAQTLGQVTFSISYVVIIVRGRLLSIGPEYEEAARDLGASQLGAFRLALLPLLWPAIFASFIVVFALSIDDFVVTDYLSAGQSTQTVPILIYSSVRGTATPGAQRRRNRDGDRDALLGHARVPCLPLVGALAARDVEQRPQRDRCAGGMR